MDNIATEKKQGFFSLVVSLPANFWYANLMEIFERLAFFGVRAIAGLYLVEQASDNGMALTYTQKGSIYAWWALIQCLVPMVSGGYTERYGYRKSLVVAFLINIVGYIGMAQSRYLAGVMEGWGVADAGYWTFLAAACFVAFGTAIFKPPCHGTIAKTTDEKTSSMGWGLFYWVVNIGGALAPMAAAELRGEIDWHYVFYGAAIVTAFNFLPLFILYREPKKDAPKEGEEQKNAIEVFFGSIFTILKDFRLVVFLLIFSCFWLMFMQLWDLMPNFIDEWVDTRDVAVFFGKISDGWVLPDGRTKPEILINIDSLAIIALVLVISWMIRKINKVVAMVIGMLISLVGFVGAGYTQVGVMCAAMIFIFAIGEMTCSPTFSAYVGLIAPKNKKALYMGYSNIPFAIGWALGNIVGGYFYDNYSAKATLALNHLAADQQLVARAARAADWSDSLYAVPDLLGIERDEAFALAQQHLGVDADKTATTLRAAFRYDQGQVENLAFLYLALHPDNRDKSISGYGKAVHELSETLEGDAARFAGEVKQAVAPPEESSEDSPDNAVASKPSTQPAPDASSIPATLDVVEDAATIRWLVLLVQQLATGDVSLENTSLPAVTGLLPTITGVKRAEALSKARDLMNKGGAPNEAKENAEVIALLWEQFGADRDVLNNLALEYLAQGTDLAYEAVRDVRFAYPASEVEKRVAEVQRKLGLDKHKAFAALSAAINEDSADLDTALAAIDVTSNMPHARLFVYLANSPLPRYEAVKRADWRHNQTLLRELIRSDEAALKLVLEKIDDVRLMERAVGAVRGVFARDEDPGVVTEEGVNYKKLANKSDLIQKALAVKDWSKTPDQAAALLAVNPYEARWLAVANPDLARQTLWDAYEPYMVWVYLGAFGLAGTIGMILFYFATRKSLAAENGDD